MIKRIISLTMLIVMAITLFSCGENKDINDERKLSFLYNGVSIAPGDDFLTVESKLGEPVGYYEAASCAFDGKDKIYSYPSLQISVSPLEGKDIIYMVTLLDDALSTPEGICVGSNKSDVVAAYGEGENKGSSLVYRADKVDLVFIIRDDCVTSIQYRYVDAVIET